MAITKPNPRYFAGKTKKPIPGSDLTVKQKKAAAALRAARPLCIPGTNAIISAADATYWHYLVTKATLTLKLNPQQVPAFCDACGVAD